MNGGRKDLSIGIGVINGIITRHYHSIPIYVWALGMTEQIPLHYDIINYSTVAQIML